MAKDKRYLGGISATQTIKGKYLEATEKGTFKDVGAHLGDLGVDSSLNMKNNSIKGLSKASMSNLDWGVSVELLKDAKDELRGGVVAAGDTMAKLYALIDSFDEQDPTVPSEVKTISQNDIDNWNDAFAHSQIDHSSFFRTPDLSVTNSSENNYVAGKVTSNIIETESFRYDKSWLSGGITSPAPSVVNNLNGTINVAEATARVYSTSNWKGLIKEYTIALATLSIVDNSTNYIVVNYNSGDPEYQSITDVTLINESDVIPVFTIYREGNDLTILSWDELADGLPNRLNARFVKTRRFERESGLGLSVYGTKNVRVDSGIVWYGANNISLNKVDTDVDVFYHYYHSAGIWTKSLVTEANNTQYDDGTNLQTLGANKYVVNWIYRSVESSDKAIVILGDEYNTLVSAEDSQAPILPQVVSTQSVLVGRIIMQEGNATPISIESAFEKLFSPTAVSLHNDLSQIDGTGTYHFSQIEHTRLSAITDSQILNWDTAYGWGDHSLAGYLKSFTETDPTVPTHVKTITAGQITNWDNAWSWGDHAGLYINRSGDSVTGNFTFTGNVNVIGDFTQSGIPYVTNAEYVNVENHLSLLNAQEVGTGVSNVIPGTLIPFSGWEIERGSEENFFFGFDEDIDRFVVGKKNSLQQLAAMDNGLIDGELVAYNTTNKRLENTVVNLSSQVAGTLADGSLSSNIALKNIDNNFSANQTINKPTPTFQLKSTDMSILSGETIGSYEFYSSDADGAHISGYIKSIGQENFGRQSKMTFGITATNSTDAVDRFEINSLGVNSFGNYQIGGADINTAGTLSNVAYLNQANTFSQRQAINASTPGGQYALDISNTSTGDGFRVITAESTSNNGLIWQMGSTVVLNAFSNTSNQAFLDINGGYQVGGQTVIDNSRNFTGGSGIFTGQLDIGATANTGQSRDVLEFINPLLTTQKLAKITCGNISGANQFIGFEVNEGSAFNNLVERLRVTTGGIDVTGSVTTEGDLIINNEVGGRNLTIEASPDGSRHIFRSTNTISGYSFQNNTETLLNISAGGVLNGFDNWTTTGTVTAANFILSSDETLKNFKDEVLPDLSGVAIRKFNYKDDESKRDRYGVSAQELQKVAPEMVYENEAGKLQVGYIDFLLAKIDNLECRIKELEV